MSKNVLNFVILLQKFQRNIRGDQAVVGLEKSLTSFSLVQSVKSERPRRVFSTGCYSDLTWDFDDNMYIKTSVYLNDAYSDEWTDRSGPKLFQLIVCYAQ